jgi:hypothetical protein
MAEDAFENYLSNINKAYLRQKGLHLRRQEIELGGNCLRVITFWRSANGRQS